MAASVVMTSPLWFDDLHMPYMDQTHAGMIVHGKYKLLSSICRYNNKWGERVQDFHYNWVKYGYWDTFINHFMQLSDLVNREL